MAICWLARANVGAGLAANLHSGLKARLHPAMLIVALSFTLQAAEIREVDFARDGKRYFLHATTWLEAPAEAIFDVLTDYERFGRISSVYKESGYLEPEPDGTQVVFTRVVGCVTFFCKQIDRVETLVTETNSVIVATVIPERSDFLFSRAEWRFEPAPGGTFVSYDLEMEPDFWVPPIIGPWLIKRRLLNGGVDAVHRIEQLALGEDTSVAAHK